MAVTLEAAKQNSADDIELAIIDEFAKSPLLEYIPFDDAVNPAGGGATLTYGYRRETQTGTAAFRAINSEYVPEERPATTTHAVELTPLGGAFEIDRVLAKIGPVATNEVTRQLNGKIEGARAKFADALINGDSSAEANAFDGLSKLLTGTTTHVGDELGFADRSEDGAFALMDALDEFLALMSGEPTVIIANKKTIARIKSAGRRASVYTEKPGPLGHMRAFYGNAALVDPGQKPGTNTDIIPVTDGVTSLYAARFSLDDVHGVSLAGQNLINYWLPDFSTAGAVKRGEVEMGPVAIAVKRTKSAAMASNIRIAPSA